MKKALVQLPLVLTGLLLVLSSCGNTSTSVTSNASSNTSRPEVPASQATVTVSELSYEWAPYPDDPYTDASKNKWVHDGTLTANEPYLLHFSFVCISNYSGDYDTRSCLAQFTTPLNIPFYYVGCLYYGNYIYKDKGSGFYYHLSNNTMTTVAPFDANKKAYVETIEDLYFFIHPQTTGSIAISLAVAADYPDVLSVVWEIDDTSNNLSLEVE
jgi:hypothetical protein